MSVLEPFVNFYGPEKLRNGHETFRNDQKRSETFKKYQTGTYLVAVLNPKNNNSLPIVPVLPEFN